MLRMVNKQYGIINKTVAKNSRDHELAGQLIYLISSQDTCASLLLGREIIEGAVV